MRATLHFLRGLVALNIKASLALRGAFWARVVFMMANNLIFFVMWWVFFERFEEVRGWRLPDMAALFGICAGAFGLAVVFGGGVRELSRLIVNGDLDSFLTQPKPPLLHSIASKSEAAGWGDVVSGAVLLGLSGYLTPLGVPAALLAMVCGALVFLAWGVMVHSLAFWAGDTSSISRQMWEFLIAFSCYPKTIFVGWLKVVLFTLLPAGFISFLPVELVRGFHVAGALAVVGGAALYTLLAVLVFRAGLRRYESGNRFGVRA